jgi:hypothetical protein
MIQKALIDILLVIAIYALGALIARFILGTGDRLGLLGLAFPLGGGVLSWSVFITSWAGLQITCSSLIVTYLVMVSLLIAVNYHTLLKPPLESSRQRLMNLVAYYKSSSWYPKVAFIGLGFLFLWVSTISVGRSYSSWDAIANWSLKGYGIAREETVFAAQNYGAFKLAYPLNVPLLISFFKLISGDILPGSKIIFPLMFASWILSLYRFWYRHQISSVAALFGALCLGTMPFIFEHATIGYADLTFACYIGLGALWGIEGIFESNWRGQAISGVLFGIACWTRAEGILYSVALVITILVAWRVTGKGRPKLLPWLLPLVLISIVWLFFGREDIGSSHLGGGVRSSLQGISQGQFNLEIIILILVYVLTQALTPSAWGLLFPLATFFLLLNWRNLISKTHPHHTALFFVVIVVCILPIALFYAGSFYHGTLFVYAGWLERSFDRAFLPALLLLGALSIQIGMSQINVEKKVQKKTIPSMEIHQ